jgi:hypothetical protein
MWKNKILMTGRDSVKHRLYVGYSGAWYSKVATADVRFIEEEANTKPYKRKKCCPACSKRGIMKKKFNETCGYEPRTCKWHRSDTERCMDTVWHCLLYEDLIRDSAMDAQDIKDELEKELDENYGVDE